MRVNVQVKNIVAIIEDDMGDVIMDYSAENYKMSLDVTKLSAEVAKLVESVRQMIENDAS